MKFVNTAAVALVVAAGAVLGFEELKLILNAVFSRM